MKVYVVIQKDEPDTRVRGIFSTKQKAKEAIGQPPHKSIKCNSCGHIKINPAYESWKNKLSIHEWEVQ